MAAQGRQGAFLRRGWRGGSTRQNPNHTPAPDLVNRNFTATAPNRLWVADATRIRGGDGVFWLAVVRDAELTDADAPEQLQDWQPRQERRREHRGWAHASSRSASP